MAKDIDTYLRELQAAMSAAGADPALVQDALFDAEEYLRAEMAARYEGEPASVKEFQTRFAAVMEGYGTPEEVAAAYVGPPRTTDAGEAEAVEAEVSGAVPAAPAAPVAPAPPVAPTLPVAPAPPAAAVAPGAAVPAGVAAGAAAAASATRPSVWEQIFGVFVDPAVYKALVYMILSLATGIAYFTIVVTGVSTAGGMLVLIIGIPLFLLVLGIVRGMALFESRLVEGLLGTRMPRRERAGLPEANLFQRMWFWVKDGRTWASMAYMILMLPLGIAYFTIAVTGLATGFGLIASPFGHWAQNHVFIYRGIEYTFNMPGWAMPLAVIGGVLLIVLWMHLIRWIGRGHAVFAKNMLVRLAH